MELWWIRVWLDTSYALWNFKKRFAPIICTNNYKETLNPWISYQLWNCNKSSFNQTSHHHLNSLKKVWVRETSKKIQNMRFSKACISTIKKYFFKKNCNISEIDMIHHVESFFWSSGKNYAIYMVFYKGIKCDFTPRTRFPS